jgi:MIP family channel proteins
MLAEVFGTFTLIMFGNGVVASQHMQSALNTGAVSDPFASNQYVNMGWGLAVTFGVMVSFETSGAHLNPAVTLTQMVFSDMTIKRGSLYMVAQLIGAILGALVVTINYVVFKGGDALTNFYCTAPFDGVSHANAFFQEVVCTTLLLAGISAIGSGNPPVNKFHVAGFVGALVFAIGNCFGSQTGYAMNPARDLGPRLVWAAFSVAYGQPGISTVIFGDGYWAIPVFAPLVGGPLGAFLYKLANHPQRRAEIAPATNTDFSVECTLP